MRQVDERRGEQLGKSTEQSRRLGPPAQRLHDDHREVSL